MFLLVKEIRKKYVKEGKKTMKLSSRKGYGINEVIGIAAGVIIAAVIVIPGLRQFALQVMEALTTWWTGASSTIFQ
ncbi:MAG: hypothetical protein ACYCYM_00820 [Saccharofermentanales bacterium]